MDALTPLTFSILVALADAPRHGYGIIKEIETRTGRGSAPSTGALYLALQRMEAEGLIEPSKKRPSDADARRRYWALTRGGREAARAESRRLATVLEAARQKDLIAGDPA
ncbi:MAG: PadR family transcriptional regulator [Gemmatimonadales bacterium]